METPIWLEMNPVLVLYFFRGCRCCQAGNRLPPLHSVRGSQGTARICLAILEVLIPITTTCNQWPSGFHRSCTCCVTGPDPFNLGDIRTESHPENSSINQGSADHFHRGQNEANLGVFEHRVLQNLIIYLQITYFQNMAQHASDEVNPMP